MKEGMDVIGRKDRRKGRRMEAWRDGRKEGRNLCVPGEVFHEGGKEGREKGRKKR